MGDIEDYFPEKGEAKKPYPSVRALSRKKDAWQLEREKKKK